MRLFRRTLLCLVVGVTSFGAAGWVFRPKATWSTELGVAVQGSFIGGVSAGGAMVRVVALLRRIAFL